MVLIMLQRVNHEYKTKTIGNASAQTPPPENPGHTNQPAHTPPPPPPPPKKKILNHKIHYSTQIS